MGDVDRGGLLVMDAGAPADGQVATAFAERVKQLSVAGAGVVRQRLRVLGRAGSARGKKITGLWIDRRKEQTVGCGRHQHGRQGMRGCLGRLL